MDEKLEYIEEIANTLMMQENGEYVSFRLADILWLIEQVKEVDLLKWGLETKNQAMDAVRSHNIDLSSDRQVYENKLKDIITLGASIMDDSYEELYAFHWNTLDMARAALEEVSK